MKNGKEIIQQQNPTNNDNKIFNYAIRTNNP